MKNLILSIAVFMLGCVTSLAQDDIWVNGFVYTEDAGQQKAVPFAIVALFDSAERENLQYLAICGPEGYYSIRPYNHIGKYFVVATADGFKELTGWLSPVPDAEGGKQFTGNITLNLPLLANDAKTDALCQTGGRNVAIDSSCLYVADVLKGISGIKKDGEDWVTGNDRSVVFFANGMFVGQEALENLEKLPINLVESITLYDLTDNHFYGQAVCIRLKMGQSATFPGEELLPCLLFKEVK